MSLQDFLLANHRQPVPAWLEGFDPNRPPTGNELVRSFLASRIVFYPGSGQDGSTVQVFNEGQAAQCFLYVDYGMTRAAVLTELEERGFSGYSPIGQIDLLESDFPTGRWERHIEPGEVEAPPPPIASPSCSSPRMVMRPMTPSSASGRAGRSRSASFCRITDSVGTTAPGAPAD